MNICVKCSGQCRVLTFAIIIIIVAKLRAGSYFPDQGLNLRPLQWKLGVLTTGPPGKPRHYYYYSPLSVEKRVNLLRHKKTKFLEIL